MRVGIISDVHGNLVALDSVLAELQQQNAVDTIVCLGDLAATGPRPHETLDRLRSLKVPIVKGNRDEFLLCVGSYSKTRPNAANDDYSRRIREIDQWCRTRLTENDLEYIRSFPDTLSMPIAANNNEKLLCFHGSPKSNTDLITAETPDGELDLKLEGHTSRLMAGGHTHVQMFRRYNESAIVNPGSIGQAIEKFVSASSKRIRRVPRAEYAIIECNEQGVLAKVELLRKSLIGSEVLADAMNSGMPHAEWWAGRS